MRQLLMNMGGVVVARMPRPTVQRGTVLIRVRYSLVSVGTEIAPLRPSSVASPDVPPLERALTSGLERARLARHYFKASLRDPRKAARRLSQIAERRFRRPQAPVAAASADAAATSDVNAQGWAIGYSAAGEVVAVGDGVTDLAAGDLVAAAGAGQANHADYVLVPRNLVCRVPAGCDLKAAASATVGAIALQGVRRAAPQLGDRVAVIGLGLIGQLTVQLLRAAGCHAIGLDLDPGRVARARDLGLDAGATTADELKAIVRDRTGGHGADATLMTAATKSSAVVNLAMELTRAKGTVVIVGDVGLNVDRAIFYRKEIDLLMSTSYGPGRYDPDYEAEGHDYPYGYVRWTLNRNMQAYLDLVAAGRVAVAPLIDRVTPIESAPAVYDELARADGALPLGVVVDYGDAPADAGETRVTLRGHRPSPPGRINYALVGAGAFGTGMLVPQMRKRDDRYALRGVVSRTAQGSNFARDNQVEVLASDLEAVLRDERFHLVVLATRHHEHADQVLQALAAGKHVFVEKPLALSWDELDRIVAAYAASESPPLLMVGFNRRFSPALQALQQRLAARRSPLVIQYRLNAGYLPLDHWVHGPQGGGRNVGEACHMYDVFRFLCGAPVRSIDAVAIDPGALPYARSDNFTATIGYEDGSIASLVYTALGPKSGMGKEHITVFCDGEAFVVDDFRKLTRASDGAVLWQSGDVDKGHFEELSRFGDAIASGGTSPIPFAEIVETSAVALSVDDLIHGRV
ncbi:MAG TPA: bi-domain-containing oxidoreductase [Vicinamibacterales bacterium]|nr:bi-domain-containing oxidoreductase [Vicinamibacterales bacterium]